MNELKALIKQGESENLEFKTSTAEIRSAFETVCAFLNTVGGLVLIGAKDSGQIIGQDVSPNTYKDIAREMKKIEPIAPISVNYIKLNDLRSVIAIKINERNRAPYTYDGRAYYRVSNETNRMAQNHYEQLLVNRVQLDHSWENLTADEYHIDDLDREQIYKIISEGVVEKRIPVRATKEDVKKILRQLMLITEDGKIKRAAVVLFAKEIKSSYMQCWLKMARFNGLDKTGDFIDHQHIHCNLFRMIIEADNFLRNHLPMGSYFKPNEFKRTDKFVLPTLAVREALVNAVCHRDYADRAGYVSIAIFDDRVEIWNNGTLPDKLKIKNLKYQHDSILRNQLIAKVLYLCGYVESWGTGIQKMIDSSKEYGTPAPHFSERTGGFLVEFKFSQSIGIRQKQSSLSINARQSEMLDLLKESTLNVSQLIDKLPNKLTARTIQKDLIKLEALGFVSRQGKARATMWAISKKK